MKHTTPKVIRPPHVAPPLPADVAQLLRSELRSRNASRKRLAMEACLAARAFAAGFARGADPERAYRRHVVGPHHEHWLCGYDAGQRAAEQAAQRYLRDQLELPSTATGDARAPSESTDAAAAIPRPSVHAQPARRAHAPRRNSHCSSEVPT
jgi:hypothetical protein